MDKLRDDELRSIKNDVSTGLEIRFSRPWMSADARRNPCVSSTQVDIRSSYSRTQTTPPEAVFAVTEHALVVADEGDGILAVITPASHTGPAGISYGDGVASSRFRSARKRANSFFRRSKSKFLP